MSKKDEGEESVQRAMVPASPSNVESRRWIVYIHPEDRKDKSDIMIHLLVRNSPDSSVKAWDTIQIREHDLILKGEMLVLSEREALGIVNPKFKRDDWLTKYLVESASDLKIIRP